MNQLLIIEPDGSLEFREIALKHGADYREIAAVLQPFFPGADFERVRVFTNFDEDKPRYRDMFVDEDGVRKGLPENAAATRIYHNNVRVHDPNGFGSAESLETAARVHGRAVLFRDPVWS